jgi:hypothetical protein
MREREWLYIELSPAWEAASCAEEFPILWNPKVHSQEPSTGPYPEPDQSSPHRPTLSFLRSILILSTQIRLRLPRSLFPSCILNNYMHSSSPYWRYMPFPHHPSWFDHSNYTADCWRKTGWGFSARQQHIRLLQPWSQYGKCLKTE